MYKTVDRCCKFINFNVVFWTRYALVNDLYQERDFQLFPSGFVEEESLAFKCDWKKGRRPCSPDLYIGSLVDVLSWACNLCVGDNRKRGVTNTSLRNLFPRIILEVGLCYTIQRNRTFLLLILLSLSLSIYIYIFIYI
jgi:hypothetical protein